MSTVEVHIVHDEGGRILAIAPVTTTADDSGVRRGVTPAPAEGQFAARLTLTDAHLAVGPVALVRDFEVDLSTEQAGLRRRAIPSA